MTDTLTTLLPGVSVSRETFERLVALSALVQKWSPRINLVAPSSLDDLWTRHILDSAQLLPLAPTHPDHWVDLGSGAGFPGLVVATLYHGTPRSPRVTLVESDRRKAAFLRTCVRDLGLRVSVLAQRIEDIAPLHGDVVSARALAPLPRLLHLVQRHGTAEGIALLPKGRTAASEVDAARPAWRFQLDTLPSQTQSDAAILRLERIARA